MDYMGMAEKRAAEAKSDLIGWMYKSDLFNLLGVENDQTKGERAAWTIMYPIRWTRQEEGIA